MQHESFKSRLRRNYGPMIQKIGNSTGMISLFARINKISGAVILMYHSVADEAISNWIDPSNHVPADIFEQQMYFLSKNRDVISMSKLISIIEEGKSPPAGTVVITFDDGYLDNYTVAAPVLEKYNLHATLFLATGYIDRGEPQWIDQIYSLFKFRTQNKLDWYRDGGSLCNLKEPLQKEALYKTICREMIISGPKKRKEILNRLAEELKPESELPGLTMRWDNVRSLISEYTCFELGGHTLEHTDLTVIPVDEAEYELNACRDRIAEETGCKARFFSFCYGRTSEILRKAVERSGFAASCGGEGLDPIVKKDADVYRLPRVAAPPVLYGFDLETDYKNTGIWRKLGR